MLVSVIAGFWAPSVSFDLCLARHVQSLRFSRTRKKSPYQGEA